MSFQDQIAAALQQVAAVIPYHNHHNTSFLEVLNAFGVSEHG